MKAKRKLIAVFSDGEVHTVTTTREGITAAFRLGKGKDHRRGFSISRDRAQFELDHNSRFEGGGRGAEVTTNVRYEEI